MTRQCRKRLRKKSVLLDYDIPEYGKIFRKQGDKFR